MDYALAETPWAVLSLSFLICRIGVVTPQLMGLNEMMPPKQLTQCETRSEYTAKDSSSQLLFKQLLWVEFFLP